MEISNLPNEIVQHIFDFLDHDSRMTVREVCFKWNELAATTQFTDRSWLHLNFKETDHKLMILGYRFRKYRHVIINCQDSKGRMNQLAEMFAGNNVESLALYNMKNVTEIELIIMFRNIPNLKRLYLLGENNNEICCSELLNCEHWFSYGKYQWVDIFTNDSMIMLQNVQDVVFFMGENLNCIQYFLKKFPNLKHLQVEVNHLSEVNSIIGACKNQLEKVSICSKNSYLCELFDDINSSQSYRCYLYSEINCSTYDINNPDHSKNIRHLRSKVDFSMYRTICSNCPALQVLEVFNAQNIYWEHFKDTSKLTNLQKLSIHFTEPPLDRKELVQDPNSWQQIQSLKCLKIYGYFRSTSTLLKLLMHISPNLEELTLEDIGQPEDTLRILSKASRKIRHLNLTYKTYPGKSPRHNIGFLQNKPHLVTYSLKNVLVDDDGMQKWVQLAPNLRKLSLASCMTLRDQDLATFDSCCPKLRQLDLKDCDRITTQGVQDFRLSVPRVTVNYEEKMKGDVA